MIDNSSALNNKQVVEDKSVVSSVKYDSRREYQFTYFERVKYCLLCYFHYHIRDTVIKG